MDPLGVAPGGVPVADVPVVDGAVDPLIAPTPIVPAGDLGLGGPAGAVGPVGPELGKNILQGGPSGHGKPPVDLVPTVLAASGPLL